jgi:hypothetical protein
LELTRKAVRIAPVKQTKHNTFIIFSEPIEVEITDEVKMAVERVRKAVAEARGKRFAACVLTDDGKLLPMYRRWAKGEHMFVEVKACSK